jgi:hypothetical protein
VASVLIGGPLILTAVVSVILSIRVVPVVSIRKSFSGLFFYRDHLLHRAFEFFISSRVFFVEIMKLPFG